jgi:hypothetical protein
VFGHLVEVRALVVEGLAVDEAFVVPAFDGLGAHAELRGCGFQPEQSPGEQPLLS